MKLHHFFTYNGDILYPHKSSIVSEFPVQLIVNGNEIATLICSPHDLRFLIAGFLRLQGFVTSLDDFEMFSVCEEFGIANIKLKFALPDKLRPVLTSGCGTGVTFTLPCGTNTSKKETNRRLCRFTPENIFNLMHDLSQHADNYKNHGGIHSAAIARNGHILLYAEDIGRHNTLDRIAGEALFKGVDLEGTELLTSGRVSSEMVAKASLMGVRLIASRTSPTDMAVKLSEQAGICLLGYVRAGKFNVYTHPEMIEPPSGIGKIDGVTGIILAGGASSRMGTNKALLEVDGVTIIEQAYRKLSSLFHEVLVVTNSPELYDFLPCRKVPDLFSDVGSIAGLHSGLSHSSQKKIFVTACDMPNINTDLIRELNKSFDDSFDALIPYSQGGQEPLHAYYSRRSLPVFTAAIEQGELKILDCLKKINTKFISWEEIQRMQGAETTFINVNTPAEFNTLLTASRGAQLK